MGRRSFMVMALTVEVRWVIWRKETGGGFVGRDGS